MTVLAVEKYGIVCFRVVQNFLGESLTNKLLARPPVGRILRRIVFLEFNSVNQSELFNHSLGIESLGIYLV